MSLLSGFRVAVLATRGFEEAELLKPVEALENAGAHVTIVSHRAAEIQALRGDWERGAIIKVDRTIGAVSAKDFDGVHLPGGTLNADAMRILPEVQQFLRDMQDAKKPIAAICHAPWELISAGLVLGRTLTSYHSIQDDVRNAGGLWIDDEVVVDDNWVTSRQPSDIPAYNSAMIEVFARSLEPSHH